MTLVCTGVFLVLSLYWSVLSLCTGVFLVLVCTGL